MPLRQLFLQTLFILKKYDNGEHYMREIYYICVPKFILRNETIKNHKINHQQGERIS